jgi:hypothetical protein
MIADTFDQGVIDVGPIGQKYIGQGGPALSRPCVWRVAFPHTQTKTAAPCWDRRL